MFAVAVFGSYHLAMRWLRVGVWEQAGVFLAARAKVAGSGSGIATGDVQEADQGCALAHNPFLISHHSLTHRCK